MRKMIKKNGWLFVFFISFAIHLVCNFFVPIIHFNPDELGAITAAAKFAGYDWSIFWSELQLYYGVVFGIVFTPLFWITDNPFVLYQLMLGIVAFFHSLIAPLAWQLLVKDFKIENDILSFLGAIGCSFMVAWRSSNVMNETPLLLCVWLVFFLLVRLQNNEHKIRNTIFLIMALCFSYLSHTRALILIIATLMTIVAYFVFTKRSLVHPIFFVIAGITGFFATRELLDLLEISVFAKNENGVLHNSLASMGEALKVDSGVAPRKSWAGVAGFLDMLTGNLFAVFVMTFGVALVAGVILLWKTYKALTQRFIKKEVATTGYEYYYPGLFCALGLVGSLVAYSILNMSYAMAAYAAKVTISYYLYPRYGGIYFGPLMIVLLVAVCKEKLQYKWIGFLSMFIFWASSVYAFVRYMYDCAIKGGDVLDAWRVLLPLVFTKQWNKSIEFKDFIQVTIIVSVLFIVLLICCKCKQRILFVILLTGLLIYQYVITTVVFDRGISQYSYNLVDKTYELLKDSDVSEYVEKIYIDNNSNRRTPYILQFLLPEKKIVFGFSEDDKDADVIFSTNLSLDLELYNGYWFFLLDNDVYKECFLIKDKELKELLESKGFVCNIIGQ